MKKYLLYTLYILISVFALQSNRAYGQTTTTQQASAQMLSLPVGGTTTYTCTVTSLPAQAYVGDTITLSASCTPSPSVIAWVFSYSGYFSSNSQQSSVSVVVTANCYPSLKVSNYGPVGSPGNVITITVYNRLDAGSFSPNSLSIGYNTSPGMLPISAATGGKGSYAYQWQSSANNSSWTNIGGATSASYTPGNLTGSVIYYRRMVTSSEKTAYSNSLTITVLPPMTVGTVSANGNNLVLTGTSGGSGSYIYQWQSSADNINWTNISGAAAVAYTAPDGLPATVYYRVQVSDGAGTPQNSNSISIKGAVASVESTPPALSSTQNYIASWTATAPVSDPTTLTTKPLSDVKLTVQYFDGLGRPLQTVAKQGSLATATNTATDLVTPVAYDAFGREAVKYLPYAAASQDGSYKTNALTDQPNWYGGGNAPDSGQGELGKNAIDSILYEASPLNRVLKEMAPGNSWVGSGRGVQQGYWINTAADNVQIWNVNIATPAGSGFSSYSNGGAYQPGTLYKNITTDEANHQVVQFTDKDGHIILKKVQAQDGITDNGAGSGYTGWLCTYYIYDDLNNLRCVIQPEGVKQLAANGWQFSPPSGGGGALAEQCFRYEYDSRNRMIMKQVPGAGAVYMVYDNRDRLVMTQDADLRNQGAWIVTNYDNLNRPDTTYLYSTTTPFTTLLTAAAATNPYPAFPPSGLGLLTATHYDDYNGITFPAGISGAYNNSWNAQFSTDYSTFPYPVMPVQVTTSTPVTTKGLVTWTQTKILNSSPAAYITTVNIYDDKSRLIQTQSYNAGDSTSIVTTTQYTWAGQPLITITRSVKFPPSGGGGAADTLLSVTKMTYDELNRLVKTEIKQSNSKAASGAMTAFAVMNELQYDALGQVKVKKLGRQHIPPSGGGGAALETQLYEYNVRGWLLGVNRNYVKDIASTNNRTTTIDGDGEAFTESGQSSHTVTYPNTNYFGFDLGYDKTNNNLIGGQQYTAAQYTGNIAGMVWKNAYDSAVRKYDFTYDPVNRLQNSSYKLYAKASNSFSNSIEDYTEGGITYDNNGNIQTLQRKGNVNGTPGTIDNLTYSYQLQSNKLLSVTDVSSNAAGFNDGNKTGNDYAYDANGNLTQDLNKGITNIEYNYLNLPAKITMNTGVEIQYIYDAAGNKLKKVVTQNGKATTTQYIGNAVYINDTLQFIFTPEGRARYTYNSSLNTYNLVYDYFLKDHLGSTRVVITDDYNVANPILQTSSYYAFGMEMEGISESLTATTLQNKYKYNGKEQQEELGATFDYGARFYMADIGRWGKTDGKAESYFATSPYVYALDQPTNAIDPDGHLVIFINGNHFGTSGRDYWRRTVTERILTSSTLTGVNSFGIPSFYNAYTTTTRQENFDEQVMTQLGDKNARYYDGSGGGWHPAGDPFRKSSSALGRWKDGGEKGYADAADIIANLARDKNNNIVETIKVITHSMGGAYGNGFVDGLQRYISLLPVEIQQQIKITLVADFDPFQAGDFRANPDVKTQQFKHANGWNIIGMGWLANEDEEGAEQVPINKNDSSDHSIFSFFNDISSLAEGTYIWDNLNQRWFKL